MLDKGTRQSKNYPKFLQNSHNLKKLFCDNFIMKPPGKVKNKVFNRSSRSLFRYLKPDKNFICKYLNPIYSWCPLGLSLVLNIDLHYLVILLCHTSSKCWCAPSLAVCNWPPPLPPIFPELQPNCREATMITCGPCAPQGSSFNLQWKICDICCYIYMETFCGSGAASGACSSSLGVIKSSW